MYEVTLLNTGVGGTAACSLRKLCLLTMLIEEGADKSMLLELLLVLVRKTTGSFGVIILVMPVLSGTGLGAAAVCVPTEGGGGAGSEMDTFATL